MTELAPCPMASPSWLIHCATTLPFPLEHARTHARTHTCTHTSYRVNFHLSLVARCVSCFFSLKTSYDFQNLVIVMILFHNYANIARCLHKCSAVFNPPSSVKTASLHNTFSQLATFSFQIGLRKGYTIYF